MFWEETFGVFFVMTLVIGGSAAWATGRAVAATWRPKWQMYVYCILLACVLRFFHYALFNGTLLSFRFFVVDLIVLFLFAELGFRIYRMRQMTRQYGWLNLGRAK
jgi:hypothetical protein